MRPASLASVAFVLVAPARLAQSGGSLPAPQPALIVVAGTADTTIAADRASIEIAVDTRGATADEAGRVNARIQHAVIAALRAAGADSAQISTREYSVHANMKPDGPNKPMKQDGYVADNTIRLVLSRFDRMGAFIDTALAAGASRIGDVTFTSTTEREARRRVLAQAVANARADADAMARAAGGSLGRLVEVSTEHPGVTLSPLRLDQVVVNSTNEVTTEITPRPIAVRTTVYGRWEFAAKP